VGTAPLGRVRVSAGAGLGTTARVDAPFVGVTCTGAPLLPATGALRAAAVGSVGIVLVVPGFGCCTVCSSAISYSSIIKEEVRN
jgi:hypothetical protein